MNRIRSIKPFSFITATGWAETFEWGLARVLDGIEALITSRRPRRRTAST